MRIILKKAVKKIGSKGDIVVVKDGFAQNFLIPQGFGVPATVRAMRDQKQHDQKEHRKKEKSIQKGEDSGKRIAGKRVRVVAKASPEGTLFASIKSRAIIEAAKKQTGAELTAKELNVPVIKKVGTYVATATAGKGGAEFQIVVEAE